MKNLLVLATLALGSMLNIGGASRTSQITPIGAIQSAGIGQDINIVADNLIAIINGINVARQSGSVLVSSNIVGEQIQKS